MTAVLDIGYRTAPADAVGEIGAVIRPGRDGIEMVNLRWGLQPRDEGGRPFTLVRAEGRGIDQRRCLVPASEFYLSRGGRRYRFTLADGDWFYFAGIWRPKSRCWPEAYAIVTIASAADVEPFHDRQMAVIRRCDRNAWLEGTDDPPAPLAAGSFMGERVDTANEAQQSLAL